MKLDCRPLDHAGALTDPEQSDREGDKAEDEKQFAHGTFLAGGDAPIGVPGGGAS